MCGVCECIICMMCMCKYIQVVSSSLWHAALEFVFYSEVQLGMLCVY